MLRRAPWKHVAAAVRTLPPLDAAWSAALLRHWYHRVHGRAAELDPPRRFTEHVVARLLRDRDPRLRTINDKLAGRDFVRDRVGGDCLIPLLGTWRTAEAIGWDELPDAFVLKASHGSAWYEIVTDKARAPRAELLARAAAWLSHDYHTASREWGYRGIPRRLLAEQLLLTPDGHAPDELRIFCFGGAPRVVRIWSGPRGPQRGCSIFDETGARLPFHLHARAPANPAPWPGGIAAALDLAARLSAGFVQMRVDLFLIEGRAWFGELTPYCSAGRAIFSDPEWDLRMGRMWTDAAAGQVDR